MFIGAPIWGMVGDRYGRKKNLVRALILLGGLVGATGLSTSVYELLAYRFVGGLMGGIPPTAMALIAGQAPRNKTAFCMGLLQMALFAGITLGPLIGGFLIGALGFRNGFFVSGSILISAGFAVLFLVREEFEQPDELSSASPLAQFRLFYEAVKTKEVLGVLGVIFMIQFSPSILWPILPGFLGEITGNADTVLSSGIAFSAMGFASAVSSLTTAQIGEKVGLKRLIVVCSALAGLLFIPMIFVNASYQVVLLVAISGIFSGAMLSSTSALLGLAVPYDQQGRAFGASQSAMALAMATGPTLGGTFATVIGLRQTFLFVAGTFLLVSLLSMKFVTIHNGDPPGATDMPKSDQK
jgi:DHA1 family multidrug resistance protein-like MFS transporter